MGGWKVDNGVTHSFISTLEATKLSLKLTKDDKKLKAQKF